MPAQQITTTAWPGQSFWRGKHVLITGHTGFKGAWASLWLLSLGAKVTGCSLPEGSGETLFRALGLCDLMASHSLDIRDPQAVAACVRSIAPDLVLHLAAQSTVQPSFEDPLHTLSTNIMGTAHVLDAMLATPSVRAGVVVTSDKCYRLNPGAPACRETDPLGGDDPYSASKAAAEHVAQAYRTLQAARQRQCSIATARAGNAIGGGDWSPSRLVPNAIRALHRGQAVPVYNPDTVRPWQHVLEPLSGYLWLLQCQWQAPDEYEGAWNFGPRPASQVSVRDLVERLIAHWGHGAWQERPAVPNRPEAPVLRVDASKAERELRWHAACDIEATAAATVRCYRAMLHADLGTARSAHIRASCLHEIDAYCQRASQLGLPWAKVR